MAKTWEDQLSEWQAEWAELDSKDNRARMKKQYREDHRSRDQKIRKIRKEQSDLRHADMDDWTYAKSKFKNKKS